MRAELDLFEKGDRVEWGEDRPVEPFEFKRHVQLVVPRSVEMCGQKSVVGDWKERGYSAGGYRVVFSLRCNSWLCDRCRRALSRKWIKKINPEVVERFITLTVDPKRFENPGEAVKALYLGYKKLIQAIRRDRGKRFEYFSAVEFTNAGWPHIHILQRGDYIEKAWLVEKWSQFGIGQIVDIQKIKGKGNVKKYLTKYLSKEGQAFFHHLRKIRFSKSFFVKVERFKTWLSDFVFKVSKWSKEVEIAFASVDGWENFAEVGGVSILKFKGS